MPKQPIASHRKKLGLTHKAIADLFGVDRTTVIRWERGEPLIPLKRLEDAVRIYGVPKKKIRPDIYEVA
jgi:transcriptional regulator with XRE-family HTH domain